MDIKNIGTLPQITAPMVRTPTPESAFPEAELKVSANNAEISMQAVPEVDEATSEESTAQTLKDSVDSMNRLMKSLSNSLQFSLDEDTGKTVIKVIDSTTQEVIKQFPSEEALALTKALDNQITGLFVQQQA
ncbi:MAG: flagellar protein FlaG [Azovibrio sp.]